MYICKFTVILTQFRHSIELKSAILFVTRFRTKHVQQVLMLLFYLKMKLYWHDIERIRYNGSWIERKESISKPHIFKVIVYQNWI